VESGIWVTPGITRRMLFTQNSLEGVLAGIHGHLELSLAWYEICILKMQIKSRELNLFSIYRIFEKGPFLQVAPVLYMIRIILVGNEKFNPQILICFSV